MASRDPDDQDNHEQPHILVPFYQGEGCDRNGRTIQSIWAMSDERFETDHDFIQWMFPSPVPFKYRER